MLVVMSTNLPVSGELVERMTLTGMWKNLGSVVDVRKAEQRQVVASVASSTSTLESAKTDQEYQQL
jgi:hypothetical protein